MTDSAGDASGEEQEDAADAENENAGREGDYVVPESYRRRRSEMRFEERLKRLELSRQPASPWGSGFRAKYGRFAAAGVAVFLIAGTIFLTYNHLRRNSYGFLMENAKMLYDRRMYEESLRAYREVSLMYPDRVDPFLGVALASERTGRFEEAIEAYKCVLDLEPFYNFAQDELTRISRVSEEAGKEEDGEENFSAGGDADAQKYDHAVQMGKIALLEGSYGEASRHFSDALALYSDDAGVWVSFADARAGSGDIGGAIESLQTALSKDPANEEAKSRLAGIEKSAAEKEALEKKTIQKKKSPPAKAKTMRRTKSRRTSSSSQSSIESPGL
ncbi:MAG: tetratricopeptide repeat protein [Synergistaceae bacterium]|nr:tetratricopeptide repeat protein [Synergistaceae bacterium]